MPDSDERIDTPHYGASDRYMVEFTHDELAMIKRALRGYLKHHKFDEPEHWHSEHDWIRATMNRALQRIGNILY